MLSTACMPMWRQTHTQSSIHLAWMGFSHHYRLPHHKGELSFWYALSAISSVPMAEKTLQQSYKKKLHSLLKYVDNWCRLLMFVLTHKLHFLKCVHSLAFSGVSNCTSQTQGPIKFTMCFWRGTIFQ